MFYFVWALGTLAVGVTSYNFGQRYGQKFVATVLSYELEEVIRLRSTGQIYQRLRFAMDKYL